MREAPARRVWPRGVCLQVIASGVSLPLLLLPALLTAAGCDPSHAATQRAPDAAIVVVGEPIEQEIVEAFEYTGRTDSTKSVELRARVTGFLKRVLFEDGVEVTEGMPLFEIDDREYQADLEAARGALTSAQAKQEKAASDFNRVVELKKKGNVSAEEYDRADASKKDADATVQSSEAELARAQLNVEFSKIAAPISGKISRAEITEGNLIRADSTVMTTIVAVDPMYVYFDVDERSILAIRQKIREGVIEGRRDRDIPVLMGLATDRDYPHQGVLDFIENRVDPQTGTIRIRGRFDNPRPARGERVLEAGLFARIRVPIGRPTSALLLAERAIGTDQGQKFVYVVDDKDEVVYRPVSLGARHDGLRVVSEGVGRGDRIIIDGLQRVRPGSKVQPKPGDMRSRPGPPEKKPAAAEGGAAGNDDDASAEHVNESAP